VYAAESGKIEQIAYEYRQGFSGYGRVIVVRGESGRWFLYAHLNDIFVGEGEHVLEGQKIGTVGNTGFTRDDPERLISGAHLHFEVSPRKYPQDSEAERIDPVAFLAEKKKKPYFRRTRRGVTLHTSRSSPRV
jgi:murein DD-endopeptidase MepM/ murein hydrolase activator NlpD